MTLADIRPGVGLVAFLRARLDEDELWARTASTTAPGGFAQEQWDPGHAVTGVHWQWLRTDEEEEWEPFTPDPADPDQGSYPAHLASVELHAITPDGTRWRRQPWYPLFALYGAEEFHPAAAGHIQRHDPASVLADVAGRRALLEWCEREVIDGLDLTGMGRADWLASNPRRAEIRTAVFALKAMAARYVAHPHFHPDWRIDA